jgi:hypothetical protein
MRFSAAKYSFLSSNSWSTVPVMYANMRAQIIRPSLCFVGSAILPVREVWRKGVPVENQNVRNQCKTTSDARTRTSFLTLRLLSGIPFTPQLSYNPSNDGDTRNPVRPSLNPNFTARLILGDPNRYFNPDAFITPLAGTWGNASRNFLNGPGLAATDLSVSKRFR